MSIDHKAYLFRYDEFQREFADLLYRALQTGELGPVGEFIHRHHSSLTDPLTEEPLAEGWEAEHEMDVQRYADLALTRYYDVTDNLGLGYGFDALGAYLHPVPGLPGSPDLLFCGRLFGPEGRRLDLGSMGTGLLSPLEVIRLAKLLDGARWPVIPGPESGIYSGCYYQPESAEEVRASRERLVELYRRAVESGSGILFADFNDQGVGHL